MASAQVNVHTEADGTVLSSMSLHPDHEVWAQCCTYEGKAPILAVTGPPEVHVAITVQDRTQVTRGELEFAQALAAETARYAEECAKYYVPDDQTGDGSAARVA